MSEQALELEQLRFPIGKYHRANEYNSTLLNSWISDIEKLPETLNAAIAGLNDEQLDTQYRPDGWTARQVVHHLADSHMNAYIRFKLALTEDNPTIKPYKENLWAQMEDGRTAPVATSVTLVTELHKRWVMLLNSLSTGDFERTFFHPERKAEVTLKETLGLYAWHGKHHTAHITTLKDRMKW